MEAQPHLRPAGAHQNDRPIVQIEINAQGLHAQWGPESIACGIFNEGMKDNPEVVPIKKWLVYVGSLVNPQNPEHGSTEIFSDNVGTKTEINIPKDKLPHHKATIVVQVIGGFDSRDILDEPFTEGVYSDLTTLTFVP
jgi:hypothetical protein